MFKYYILGVLSVLLFFQGFFPVSKFENGVRERIPTELHGINLNSDELYKSNITKTVIIVIDALRLDFVAPKYMPGLWEVIETDGCINQVIVESPTVTLPRIKALTSGNVPQFIDLVLNLASTEVLGDSIIHSAYENNKSIVFYGDDTWLKIFPKYFKRFEGTTSFFVKDFKEVDDNVTRNVQKEIDERDWDIMILHYLGLDHIGHVLGPYSSLVPIKLKEMEDVILQIYSKLQNNKETPLLVITGDHGMKDSGGHGGSTFSEVNVPFVVLGLSCNGGKMSQTDIPVNLAALLGLEIPSSSVGQLNSKLLSSFTREKYLLSLLYNMRTLLKKKNLCSEAFDLAKDFHRAFLRHGDVAFAHKAKHLYENCSKIVSESLVNTSVRQNLAILVFSIVLMVYILLVLLMDCLKNGHIILCPYGTVLITLLFQFFIVLDLLVYLCTVILLVFVVVNLLNAKFNSVKSFNSESFSLLILNYIHPITFFSSSFVEEEQQYWYFSTQFLVTLLIYGLVKQRGVKILPKYLLMPIGLRFLSTINQTGDKWANLPDLSDWLQKPENYYYLQGFFLSGLIFIAYYIKIHSKNTTTKLISFLALYLIYKLKNDENNNVLLGKFIWLIILFEFCLDNLLVTWLLICTLLLKPYNILLISYCIYANNLFKDSLKNNYTSTISHLWLANALYFAQGHSNSLASVDVSVGYIGLNFYQPVIVILQVLCHTYALPVLCHILLFQQEFRSSKTCTIILINRLYINIIVSIVTLVFKDHLFIWSVFAPKLFIETITTVFIFLEICLYYCCKLMNNSCKTLNKLF